MPDFKNEIKNKNNASRGGNERRETGGQGAKIESKGEEKLKGFRRPLKRKQRGPCRPQRKLLGKSNSNESISRNAPNAGDTIRAARNAGGTKRGTTRALPFQKPMSAMRRRIFVPSRRELEAQKCRKAVVYKRHLQARGQKGRN